MYKCIKCGKTVSKIESVKCPYCGARILMKVRPKVVKRVIAR